MFFPIWPKGFIWKSNNPLEFNTLVETFCPNSPKFSSSEVKKGSKQNRFEINLLRSDFFHLLPAASEFDDDHFR